MMDEECTFSDENESCNCILHCKKDDWSKDWNSKKEKIESFWKKIKSYIDLVTSNAIKSESFCNISRDNNEEFYSYNFNNVYFPPSQFNTSPFYRLNDAFKKDQHLNLNFINCNFLGEIDFHCIFKAKNINFNNCHFHSDLEFQKNSFKNLFIFENCHVYKKAVFKNIVFECTTSFIETSFYDKIDFIHINFESLALFNEVKIEELNLDNTFFKVEANFLDIKKIDGKKLESKNIVNRETARIIKHSFDKIGNIIEANKFYALEMEKREEELNDKINENKNIFEWLVFKVHKISSNHSQDWVLSLLWIIFTAHLFSLYTNILPFSLDIVLCMSITLFGVIVFLIIINSFFKTIISILIVLFYYFNAVSVNSIFSEINPFSTMKIEKLTLDIVLYKIIIAYLIYQFIVSVRQNTRRK